MAGLVNMNTFPVENHPWSGSSEGFVCCCGNNITVFKWAWTNSCSNKTTNMGHICKHICSIFISYLSESFVVQVPWVTAHSWIKENSKVIDIYLYGNSSLYFTSFNIFPCTCIMNCFHTYKTVGTLNQKYRLR